MNLLCIDIGNTRIHYGLFKKESLIYNKNILTHDLHSIETLFNDLQANNIIFDLVSFCSVVPDISNALRSYMDSLEVKYYELTSKTIPNFEIKIPSPKQVGADCLANCIAVKQLGHFPSIIIDAGTAVTLDVLDDTGAFIGNLITPGLQMMTEYLHQKAALLPRLSISSDDVTPNIGTSTIESMKIGCRVGFKGMIQEALSRVLQLFDNNQIIKIYGTGGDYEFLKDIDDHIILDPFLTLKGLRDSFKLNHQDS